MLNDGSLALDILAGAGALLAGAGILIAGLAFAKTMKRVNASLDVMDRELEKLGTPAASTLTRIDETAKSLGSAASSLSQTAVLTKSALAPVIVNAGSVLAGISAGLRRLVTGKNSKDQPG
jgi:hypothetical protein